MWHKAIWKGHPMRLELTRVGLLVELANHYTTRGAYSITTSSLALCYTKINLNKYKNISTQVKKFFLFKKLSFIFHVLNLCSTCLCPWEDKHFQIICLYIYAYLSESEKIIWLNIENQNKTKKFQIWGAN